MEPLLRTILFKGVHSAPGAVFSGYTADANHDVDVAVAVEISKGRGGADGRGGIAEAVFGIRTVGRKRFGPFDRPVVFQTNEAARTRFLIIVVKIFAGADKNFILTVIVDIKECYRNVDDGAVIEWNRPDGW